jgi:nucleoside-diphosphate-sugar epimerase
MTREEALEANLRSTEALAAVVGPETHLVHVSTAFALGLRGSTDSPDPVDYRNHYEWSKAASERLVLERFPHVTIVRPPLLIGRRSDGRVTRFNGVYTFLRAAATGLAPVLVADRDGFMELTAVDDAAQRVVELALGERPPAPVVDVLGRGDRALRVGEALALARETLNALRGRHGRGPFAECPIIEPERWDRFYLPFARQHLDRRQLRVLDLLSEFKPYLEIRKPLAITRRVADVASVLRRSLEHWGESHLALVLAEPRAWSTRAAGA